MLHEKKGKLTIREALNRFQGWKGAPTDTKVADSAGMQRPTYSEQKGRNPRQSLSLRDMAGLEEYYEEPLAAFLDRESNPLLRWHEGIAWRLESRVAGVREHAVRLAALGAVLGHKPSEIAQRIHTAFTSEDNAARAPDADEVAHMAHGGLALGLVVPELSEHAGEIERPELSKSLADALGRLSTRGVAPEVRVVANVAHPGFGRDLVAPFLIARAAHQLVRSFLEVGKGRTIGIAGGQHLDAFVRSTGPASSPFPSTPRGESSYTLVPLTLEPLYDHKHALADALVGELYARGNALLGPRRLTAPSFVPFGYICEGDVEQSNEAITLARSHYPELDVAVFGCGDDGDAGWIRHAAVTLGLRLDRQPVTDVCLNMLDAEAKPIPLVIRGAESEYLGVALRHIEPVARSRLALLLTSGASKGLPLTLVVRAGCANALVCDEAAARAALEVLG